MGKLNPSKTKTQAERIEEMSRVLDGVMQYIKQQEEEWIKDRNAALYNTRLLLRNYHKLIHHYKQAICRESDLDTDTFDIDLIVDQFSIKEVVIESVSISKKRTIIMMEHLRTCLRILESDYLPQPEKYQAFRIFYLDETTATLRIGERYKVVAEKLHCAERSARNWVDELVEALSVLLWGIDGLKPKNIVGKMVPGIK
jgi:hypothetical protein